MWISINETESCADVRRTLRYDYFTVFTSGHTVSYRRNNNRAAPMTTPAMDVRVCVCAIIFNSQSHKIKCWINCVRVIYAIPFSRLIVTDIYSSRFIHVAHGTSTHTVWCIQNQNLYYFLSITVIIVISKCCIISISHCLFHKKIDAHKYANERLIDWLNAHCTHTYGHLICKIDIPQPLNSKRRDHLCRK